MKKAIVITRPAHQAETLAQGIRAAGGDIFLFPTLAISSRPLSDVDKAKISHLNDYEIIIFISPNAVQYGLNHIQALTQLPANVLLATVGQGSAKSLSARLGRQPDIVPLENFNSEGLLATAALQNVSNKQVLIVRGNGGRELLKETLEQRGARVDYITVYQRTIPDSLSTIKLFEQHLQNNEIAAIVITSASSLRNLLAMVSEKAVSQLLQIPLLLINKRLVDTAKEMGFNNELFVANEASDSAIINTLRKNTFLP